jgi:hypothetical protein
LLAHVFAPFVHLIGQRALAQRLHGCVLRGEGSLGDHRAPQLAQQRNLVHPDFQHIHLNFLRVYVVQTGLQDVAANALLFRGGKLAFRRLLAGQAGDDAHVAHGDADGVHDFHRVAVGVQPVFAGPDDPALNTLLTRPGDKHAVRQFVAHFGGHHAHLARGNDHRRYDLPIKEDGIAEVTPFCERRSLDTLLSGFGQDLSFGQRLPVLGRDDGHLIGTHVEAAEQPHPDAPQSEYEQGQGQYGDNGFFHGAPPFPLGRKGWKSSPRPPSWSLVRMELMRGPIF